MRQLLENQVKTEAPLFAMMLRESEEFEYSEIEDHSAKENEADIIRQLR